MQTIFSVASPQNPQIASIRFAKKQANSAPTSTTFSGVSQGANFADIPADTAKAYALGSLRFGKSNEAGAVLENFLQNAHNAKNWRYNFTPQGVVFSCYLDGKKYTYACPPTDGAKPQAGTRESYSALTSPTFYQSGKEYPVSQKIGQKALKTITDIVSPIMEREYGLGPNMDATPVLLDFAEGFLDDKVVDWTVGGFSLQMLGFGMMPEMYAGASGYVGETWMAMLQDISPEKELKGTYLALKKLPGTECTVQHFQKVQKPQERAALALLTEASQFQKLKEKLLTAKGGEKAVKLLQRNLREAVQKCRQDTMEQYNKDGLLPPSAPSTEA